jgi:hypothetical protein
MDEKRRMMNRDTTRTSHVIAKGHAGLPIYRHGGVIDRVIRIDNDHQMKSGSFLNDGWRI